MKKERWTCPDKHDFIWASGVYLTKKLPQTFDQWDDAKLEKFITPKEFDEYKQMAYAKGFLMVASSPLTRSSYHASDDFKIMQENRKNKLYSIQ